MLAWLFTVVVKNRLQKISTLWTVLVCLNRNEGNNPALGECRDKSGLTTLLSLTKVLSTLWAIYGEVEKVKDSLIGTLLGRSTFKSVQPSERVDPSY